MNQRDDSETGTTLGDDAPPAASVHEVRHDETPSQAVVMAVAETLGVGARTLPPLYEAVDPDAVDAFFREDDERSLRFSYADVTVTVDGTGMIAVEDG
jgi:ketosteroid isomerase-like protein